MNLNIGMKHARMVTLRDELTKAIDGNPNGGDGRTEVVIYGPGDSDSDPDYVVNTLTITNDDMERAEVHDEQMYYEVSR